MPRSHKIDIRRLEPEMQTLISQNLDYKIRSVLFRRQKYGVDVVDDPNLQELIKNIYHGFMPVFANQVSAIKSYEKGKTRTQRIARDEATYDVILYARTAHRKMRAYLKQPELGYDDVDEKAVSVLGSIIGKAVMAFGTALNEQCPEYKGIFPFVPEDGLREPELFRPKPYLHTSASVRSL